MNKDAENKLAEFCKSVGFDPHVHKVIREAMQWAYADSMKECSAISSIHFAEREAFYNDDIDPMEIEREKGAYEAADECVRAIEQRAK